MLDTSPSVGRGIRNQLCQITEPQISRVNKSVEKRNLFVRCEMRVSIVVRTSVLDYVLPVEKVLLQKITCLLRLDGCEMIWP